MNTKPSIEMNLAIKMGDTNLRAKIVSQLISNQVFDEYQTNEAHHVKYL